MAKMAPPTPERAGPCECAYAYHVPRSPGLAPIGHGRLAEVATLQEIETPAGMVAAPSAGRRDTCGRRSNDDRRHLCPACRP
jgi:hypothetical protein